MCKKMACLFLCEGLSIRRREVARNTMKAVVVAICVALALRQVRAHSCNSMKQHGMLDIEI